MRQSRHSLVAGPCRAPRSPAPRRALVGLVLVLGLVGLARTAAATPVQVTVQDLQGGLLDGAQILGAENTSGGVIENGGTLDLAVNAFARIRTSWRNASCWSGWIVLPANPQRVTVRCYPAAPFEAPDGAITMTDAPEGEGTSIAVLIDHGPIKLRVADQDGAPLPDTDAFGFDVPAHAGVGYECCANTPIPWPAYVPTPELDLAYGYLMRYRGAWRSVVLWPYVSASKGYRHVHDSDYGPAVAVTPTADGSTEVVIRIAKTTVSLDTRSSDGTSVPARVVFGDYVVTTMPMRFEWPVGGLLRPGIYTASGVIFPYLVAGAGAQTLDGTVESWPPPAGRDFVFVYPAPDACPDDPGKTQPGVCGCGTADTDGDGDGTLDCADGCPADPGKTGQGVCGCGTADSDGDGDGTPDCNDACPVDPNKTAAGVCLCGRADLDSDGDGYVDCVDACVDDATKTAPGECGCGAADLDTDLDGVADCSDHCPVDHDKALEGVCGCGVADVDSDGDGTADCLDACATDALKTAPGLCGCGIAELDSDGDLTYDCQDACPADHDKVAPGRCGCGVADVDSDGDGTADCLDNCPDDAAKTADGVCGCGVSDADTDHDGTADCDDLCPTDPNKTVLGVCLCGFADADADGDGAFDCVDACPADPAKTAAGVCGCFFPDADGDGDRTADCQDGCPLDPGKAAPGACGCGVADRDGDGDGVLDCHDGCPADPGKSAPGVCGCGIAETVCSDADRDGVTNASDLCPATPAGARVDGDGCSGAQRVARLCVAATFKTHGGYVSCVTQQANAARALGLLTQAQRDALVVAAAQSDLGKR